MGIATYDSNKIVVTLGPTIIKGWADGSFLSIERESDSFEDYVGSDGGVARSKSNDKRATATLRLRQDSLSNDALSLAVVADELSGAGVLPFMVKDLKGTTLVLAKEAWVMKPAPIEYDRPIVEREWTIRLAEAQIFVGGMP
jgi:hypothetical protein